jgi:hypothetical protein
MKRASNGKKPSIHRKGALIFLMLACVAFGMGACANAEFGSLGVSDNSDVAGGVASTDSPAAVCRRKGSY